VKKSGCTMGFFAHPKAIVESSHIGEGTRIWAHAHIMPGAVIGRNCNIGDGCFIENEVVLGDYVTVKNGVSIYDLVTCEDYVFVGPDVCFTNDRLPRSHLDYRTPPEEWLPTRICLGASLGAGSVIICGNTVGRWAMVGAGTVVNKDVPPHALMVGNPARRAGWVCYCGHRLDDELFCAACNISFEKTGSGLVGPRDREFA
jgi:UDP-2-acetamido-3-amino-2,3-dideoxy-glucuronate N-acetyltransferase